MPRLLERPPIHLNRELDHFYADELNPNGDHSVEDLARTFEAADRYTSVALRPDDTESTVVMIDSVNTETRPEKRLFLPVDALKKVIAAARSSRTRLDYIALEGGLEPLAQDVFDTHVRPNGDIIGLIEDIQDIDDPEKIRGILKSSSVWLHRGAPGGEYTTPGERPPVPSESGFDAAFNWFSRSRTPEAWVKLFTYKTNRRGNVKLQDGRPTIDKWACPYLAAMFLAARLGSVRHESLTPQLVDPDNLPNYEQWSEYPSILQVNPDAKPFLADHAISHLPARFLEVEHGVMIITDTIDKTIADRYHLSVYGQRRTT